jgi:hypothetical protein
MTMDESAENTGDIVSVEDFCGFCEKIKEPCRKIDEIRKCYIEPWGKELKFNIFKTISPEHYDREKLHSEILGAILDPKLEIYNKKYLEIFVGLLKTINTNVEKHDFGSDYTVKIEKSANTEGAGGFIDILIYDGTHAIIIENKINNAPDMDDQLGRYYKHARDKLKFKPENIAVVYLPLDPDKEPWDSFKKEEYRDLITEIKSRYVKLPVIAKDGKNDFVHGFLIPCFKITENCTAKVFLEQYIELAKHIGGKNMFSNYQDDILKEIYKDEKSISIVENIIEIWNNGKKRAIFLHDFLIETVLEKLIKEHAFTKYEGCEHEWGKPVKDHPFDLYFGSNPEYNNYSFGFHSPEGKLEDKTIKALTEILDDVAPEPYFTKASDNNESAYWLTKLFLIEQYKAPLDKIAEYFLGRYAELESRIKSLDL